MNYTQAAEKLTGRCARARKLGNNTFLERVSDSEIAIRLHSTYIMRFRADGSIILDSGGWRTVTTKARMNEYLPDGWRISQTRGQWFVGNCIKRNWEMCLFEDGIILRPDGTFEGGSPLSDRAQILKARRAAQRYAKQFIEAMKAGRVPAPSLGDCLYCQKAASGGTLGEAFHDRGHIQSHIDEPYYVPSLLARALEVMPSSIAMKGAVGELWGAPRSAEGALLEKIQPGWASLPFIWDGIQKNLLRYILRQLGQAS